MAKTTHQGRFLRVLLAAPQVFFSFVRPIFDDLMDGNRSLEQSCERRRAEFLESEVTRLFQKAFPGAEIVVGYKWKDGEIEYENDLIVRVDSHLFLIEAKSGAVSWPALRGAPERAKKHFQDLIVAPSIQSARLADRVGAVIESPALRDSYLPGLQIQLDRVHTVLRLSVTLEDFAMLPANLSSLRHTGWLSAGHSLAPCVLVTDLEVIFDILEPKSQKIHYLRRRTELARRLVTTGDELDHLGWYLAGGFNLGEAEFSAGLLHLVEMSKEVDQFCLARADGIETERPKLQLSKWWSDICLQVERRAPNRWTDACDALLRVAPEDQKTLEAAFIKIERDLKKRVKPPQRNFVAGLPRLEKGTAIALSRVRHEDIPNRREQICSVANHSFADSNVDRCLVVAINIDAGHYPYSAIALIDRESPDACSDVDDLQVY